MVARERSSPAAPKDGRAPVAAPSLQRTVMLPFLRVAPLCLLAFIVLYCPLSSGDQYTLASLAVFAMLLLACAFLWVCNGAMSQELRWRAGPLTPLFAAFMLWAAAASLHGHDRLAAAEVWLLFATYGMTAFLVLQLAGSGAARRFLLSCFLATVVTLAAYAVFHLLVYLPALRRMLANNPEYLRSVLGLPEDMLVDLSRRISGGRAFGNFITSNQLASFLILGIFPLFGLLGGLLAAGKAQSPGSQRRLRLTVAGCLAACVLVLTALFLSGSKGGFISFVFAAAVFTFGAAVSLLKVPVRKACAAAAVLVVLAALLLVGAQQVGLAPRFSGFALSMGVRIGYWTATTQMIRSSPLLGVGPGCWEDHYTQLKQPEFEETRLAHSDYLQIWSETGTVGIALFAVLLGLLAVMVLKPMLRGTVSGSPPGEDVDEPDSDSRFSRWGLALGALAFAVDYLFVGTFHPPSEGIPPLLQACPWVVYVGLICIWLAAFHVVHDGVGGQPMFPLRRAGPFLLWGVLAGLAAFLLHTAADFTLRLPALGGSAFALAAILLMGTAPPRRHTTRLAETPAAALILLCLVPTMLWATIVAPRVLDQFSYMQKAFILKDELSKGKLTPSEIIGKKREIVEAYRRANRAVPWDSECWHDLASHAVELARDLRSGDAHDRTEMKELMLEAERAMSTAIRLNPLRAKHQVAMGDILMALGRPGEAVKYFWQAAHRSPSIPGGWLRFAEAAELFEGLSKHVCAAYGEASRLDPRQYHPRNRLTPEQKAKVEGKLKQCSAE